MARAATRSTATKQKNTVRVNFSGVETSSVIPDGDYIGKIIGGKLAETDAGNEYIEWQVSIEDGKHSGKKLYHNTSLQTQSLWATKRWLECMGVNVPDGEFDIDFEEMNGLSIGIVVEQDTYKGRTRSKIIDCFPVEGEVEGNEEEVELPTEDDINAMDKAALGELAETLGLDIELSGTTSAQRKQMIEAVAALAESQGGEDETVEIPSDEEINAMGKEALAELVEKLELGIELSGTTAAQRRMVIKACSEKREEAGGGEDEGKVKVSEVNEADEAALEEMVETHELDVDLSKLATLRKKRSAVIDALEEAEKLEDDSE